MISDSNSMFSMNKILADGISGHHSLADVSLKTSKATGSTISHSDYLIRTAPITNYFSNYIFDLLFIQLIIIGFMPNYSQYWSQDKPTEKAIRFFGYFFLVLAPSKQTQIYHIMFIFLVILFLLMNLIYFVSNFYYKKYHNTNVILCYAARYSILIISTIFYPISNSFCGEHFNTIFLNSNLNLNSIFNRELKLFVIIFFIMINCYLIDNLLFKHYDISFQNVLFKVWNPWSVTRLYILLGGKALICHLLIPLEESFKTTFPLTPVISLVLTLIIFLFEIRQINWVKNSHHIKVLTALFSNIITSTSIIIDCIQSKFNGNTHAQMVFWISIILSIIGIFISSKINKISINASLKRLRSSVYPYLQINPSIQKKRQSIATKQQNDTQSPHLNKLGSKSLDRINSSYLFKFKRFPSDDSFSSDEDDADLHKSKSNVPRTLPPMFKNFSQEIIDDGNSHHISSNEGGSENSEVSNISDEHKDQLSTSKSSVNQYIFRSISHHNSSNNLPNDLESNASNDEVEDYKSLKSVNSASTVFKDLCVGYMYADEDVILMNHIHRILEKFPNDPDIFFFLARHHFVFNTKTRISIEEIMEHLAPRSLFNPIQAHMYSSITRSLEPISIHTLSIMETSISSMNQSFVKLIDSIRSVYNLILYELTTSLPKAVLVFQHRYDKALSKLFSFVQKYPRSPDSEFYVKLFETFFPNAPEKKKLNFWLNYNANYSINDISLFPSHLSLMVSDPDCFIFNKREDRLKSRDLPIYFDPTQFNNQIKPKKVKGPFKFAFKNLFLKFSLIISILCPLITMILILMNDKNYLYRSDHINECYSFIWRIDLMSNCLYPALFFRNSTRYFITDNIYLKTKDDETMDDYMLRNLKIISQFQCDLLRFSKGVSANIDAEIFNEISRIFQNRNNSINNKTIYDILMFHSFVAEEFLIEDNVYLKQVPDVDYGLNILNNVRYNSTFVGNELYNGLKQINILKGSVFQGDLFNFYIHPTYLFVPQIITLIGCYLYLAFTLKSALIKFDLFFFSLRETSKPAVTKIHNICQNYCHAIGSKALRNQKKPNVNPYQFNFHFVVPTVIIYILMFVVIGLFVLMNGCYELQTLDTVDTYEKLTVAYHNFTSLIIDIILLQYNHDKMNETEIVQIIDEINRINSYYQGVNWFFEHDFPFYCTFCSLVDIMMMNNNKTKNTYYSSIFEWLGMSQFYINNSLYREDVAKKLIRHFFDDVDSLLIDVFDFTKENIRKTIIITENLMIFLIVLFFLLIIAFLVVLFLNIIKADSPFLSIINMLGRLPENALSKETCKILGHRKLDLVHDQFDFDPSYYEQVLKTFPHPIIVIDRLMNVDYFNTSALKLINGNEDAVDENNNNHFKGFYQKSYRKLFEVMKIELFEYLDDSFEHADESNKNKDNNNNNIDMGQNENSLCGIVEDYLFDESCPVLYKRLCTSKSAPHELFYSLTIQPIDDGGGSDVIGNNYFNQKNDFRHFVLIFKDICEEIRQQKMLAQEAQKQSKIVHQIFPPETASQLLRRERPKPMTVSNVAISFCDIVSFTPWCGSKSPEVVVTTLNQMFMIFDQMCAKYDQVIKIKCIGDCYMSAAGVFSSNQMNIQQSLASYQAGNERKNDPAHIYSYNSINYQNSNSQIKRNISITSLIKKKKKNPQKTKMMTSTTQIRQTSFIKQSNSNTDVTLNSDNHSKSANNTTSNNSDACNTNNSDNNNSESANFEDDNNQPNFSSTQPISSIPTGSLTKNKIPLIPAKVTNLRKCKTIQVNPHQRSHSKPTIRPSFILSKDGTYELSEEHRDHQSSLCSDQLSTASLNETENEIESTAPLTDDAEDCKANINNSGSIVNEDSENSFDANVDSIHHSTSHLTPNEVAAATQMLSFCLDLIDAIEIVNKKLGTELQVRVGASFGGPISAGVIGKRMPMFDIWGEIVNEANLMESSGKAMTVHIKKNYYDIVRNECYVFTPHVNERGETTYLVTRS